MFRNEDIDVTTAMQESYMAYATSVISGRAIPHVADGLKPVHRRSLYAMYHNGMTSDRPYKKSARIVGDVLGKYHPHGDNALYEAIVRMAQPFSMRYPLVNGQGNFGSIDGDGAAAMRYTEVKLTKIAELLLKNTNSAVVDFTLNYDGTESEPTLLGGGFPNLLANGSDGIAVGIATSIPPHNMSAVIDTVIAQINNPDIPVIDLARKLEAPDFPTGGIIMGNSGAIEAYCTGRGKIILRAKTHIEEVGNNQYQIVFTELPYRVNKATLFLRLSELVRDGQYPEISDLRDESSMDIRGIILLKRNQNPEVVLNRLFVDTQLQVTVSINMVALGMNGVHKQFNLKEMNNEYIAHRRAVLWRSTENEISRLKKKLIRLNAILAVNKVVIDMIRNSRSVAEAEERLCESVREILFDGTKGNFLSKEQAEHILAMPLAKLTMINVESSKDEQVKCIEEITKLKEIITPVQNKYSFGFINGKETLYPKLDELIIEKLLEVKESIIEITKGDRRLSEIDGELVSSVDEDFIDNVPVVITLTRAGYIKVTSADTYQSQNRGGTGKMALSVKDTDSIHMHLNAHMHDCLYIVTTLGRIYTPKVHTLPAGERTGRGRPISNIVELRSNESISAIIPVNKELRNDETARLVFASKLGKIKSVAATAFKKVRDTGVFAVDLNDDDSIVSVKIAHANNDIMLFTARGQLTRYPESTVRVSLRGSGMVRGIKLSGDDYVVGMEVHDNTKEKSGELLVITSSGVGKVTAIDSFRVTSSRSTRGVRTARLIDDHEYIVAVLNIVNQNSEVSILSSKGKMIQVSLDVISRMSRNAHGVKLIDLSDGEVVVSANLTL